MNISKKILLISLFACVAFGTTCCNSSKIAQLEAENIALQKQLDSLSTVANTYRKGMEKEKEISRFSAMEARRLAEIAMERAKEAEDQKK